MEKSEEERPAHWFKKGNPIRRPDTKGYYTAEFQKATTPEDIIALKERLFKIALTSRSERNSLAAIRVILDRLMGKPTLAVEVDARVEERRMEWRADLTGEDIAKLEAAMSLLRAPQVKALEVRTEQP